MMPKAINGFLAECPESQSHNLLWFDSFELWLGQNTLFPSSDIKKGLTVNNASSKIATPIPTPVAER